jgi:serine protease Do
LAAGINVDDLLIQVNSKIVTDRVSCLDAISRYKVGAEIGLKIARGKEELEVKVKLVKRPLTRTELQNNMGSALSNRRGGFPLILQHDCVLRPSDCGGPLVDLDGKALGVNIARAGRVATYAIPAQAVREVLADLMAGNLPPLKED